MKYKSLALTADKQQLEVVLSPNNVFVNPPALMGSASSTPFSPLMSLMSLAALNQATLLDQVKRVKEIEAIESDAFSTEPPELQHEPGNVGAGATEAAAPEKDPPAANIPTAIKYQDDNSLAHPNLFLEKAEAEERWFQRLVALRQERLMGS
ncbi:Serine/Arginine-related protein 53, partial [Lamprotornis superbus]